MFGTPYYLVTLDTHDKGKQLVDTFLFHTFFSMTMFNQICARCVEGEEINVFKTIMSNPIFWLVWVLEMGMQHLLLIFAGMDGEDSKLLNMSALSLSSIVIANFIGLFTFVIHVIQVKIPTGPFVKLEQKIALDDVNSTAFVDGVFSKISQSVAMDDDDDNFHRIEDHTPADRPITANSNNQP